MEQKRCATVLYLLSILAHTYNIIIDRVVGAQGHDREVVDGLNATDKRFISMLITTVKVPGASDFYTHMKMHTSTVNKEISIVS